MQVSAHARRIQMSPQKVRLIADLVRGRNVADAIDILSFTPGKGAPIVKKVLESAMANAENNEGADIDELSISEIFVNASVTMKRIMPRAKGRADRILKRTCHITVRVSDGEEE